jgi:molybdenum cofactor cytidylyltransferase
MIAAIILAAGQSRRMGQPKMLLPWGKLTVIEQVISTFLDAGIEETLVVTGGMRELVEKVIEPYPVQKIYNSNYEAGEMLSSIQLGLSALSNQVEAALISLGDQPQVQESTVRIVCEAFQKSQARLVVPSFQMRRGHPWLVARSLWNDVLALKPPESPRDFLNEHAAHIHYVGVETSSILADLDTPEDYRKTHP